MLQNDRQITISEGKSRNAAQWPLRVLLWSEFVDRLRVPARGVETWEAYMKLPKGRQDELKDVGGYVAGIVRNGGRRKQNAIDGRDVLTLDLDRIPAGGTADVLRRVDGLQCAYCVYSTRKHAPHAPRLRVLLPLDRTATADEYEPIARRAAKLIGIELCDPSTFEASRLMYWPSCCADGEYIYRFADRPFLSAGGVLELYTKEGCDWRDMTAWPTVPGVKENHRALAAKQGDPLQKPGVVGAYCRVHDVYSVIDDVLPGIYTPTDEPGRYTFAAGSTAGGAIVYDDGKFLYSHHATDPAGGRLVNAFDLARLHLFDDRDDNALPGTPVNRLPSYTAMCEYAVQDKAVADLMNRERYEEATKLFGAPAAAPEAGPDWMNELQRNVQTNQILKTIDNLCIIFERDPQVAGKIAYDEFASRRAVLGPLPWNSAAGERAWKNVDNDGAYRYAERVYGISTQQKVDSALSLTAENHKFDRVTDYLTTLTWDGKPRLDTLLIEYLGAADTPYVRAVSRKAFTAAVARALSPGCKYDTMTILTGPQGIGKSTLLNKMGRDWFSDSVKTFEGTRACELVQGVWIVEIGELEAFNRSEIGQIKQFLSQRQDIFRAAYGRNVEWHPRRCVFFGTSNNSEYLRDRTGNRRFWPVDVGVIAPTKNVWDQLDGEVDQLWAEAVTRWRMGEPLYLTGALEDEAKAAQEEHREHSAREGIILDFLDKPVPEDWDRWDLPRRMMWWGGGERGEIKTVPRARVCALEVWCEALGCDARSIRYTDSSEINAIIAMQQGWRRMKHTARFGYCAVQRGFERL